MKKLLIKFKNYSAYLFTDKQGEVNIPKEIRIENKYDIIIQLNLDAIDGMVFSSINYLKQFNKKQLSTLFQFLSVVLYQYIGGKCLFAINNNYLTIAEKYLGLNIFPAISNEESVKYKFFLNLMFGNGNNKIWVQKLQACHSKLSLLAKEYSFVKENITLVRLASDISSLLIEHTDWAGTVENKGTYTNFAIKHRIHNNYVSSCAVIDNSDGSVNGFVRIYKHFVKRQDLNFYYLSDLVVRTEKRNKGLATYLLSQALPKNGIIFLIAGDMNVVKMYNQFGFKKLNKNCSPVAITNDMSLICGIIPVQFILENYMQSLA